MPPLLRGAALVLGLGLGACTRTPPTPPEPPPTPFDEREAQVELEQAVALLAQAEADGKLDPDECTRVTAAFGAIFDPRQPRTADAQFDVGVIWERCGEPERAAAAYRETIAAAPDHAAAHNNLGVLQWRAGQLDAAAQSFRQAANADGTAVAARNNLATALRDRYLASGEAGDFEQAEHALRGALAVDSDNAVAYENLARLYYDRGRHHDRSYLLLADLVITQANRILEEHQRPSAELYNLRGLLHMEDGDQVAAIRAFQRATEIDPDHAEAHLNIAMIALRFRDYATAESSLERALADRRHGSDVTALLGLGVAQRGLRDYAAAEKTLTRARELDGADPRALYNLGILYQEHVAPQRSQVADAREGATGFDDGPYLDARRYFERFTETASDRYPEQVADARLRIASIDQFLRDIEDLEDLKKQQEALEAEARRQQAEERERLLKLEARAKQAHQGDRPAEPEPAP